MEIIRKRERVEEEKHFLHFDKKSDPDSGYSFDCDEHGNVTETGEAALRSYRHCLDNPDEYLPPRLVALSNRYTEPAVGRCECGREVVLDHPLDNTCECGRNYNMSGQLVRLSSEAEEPYWED
jgi:hypothetical protein